MKRLRVVALAVVAYIATAPMAVVASPNCSADPATPSPAPGSQDATELVIGVVIFDKVTLLDIVGPASYLEFLPLVKKPVRFVTVSNHVGRIQPDSLVPLYASTAYADAPTKFDVLVVPGGPRDAGVIAEKAFLDYVKRAAEQSTFVLSVCTGPNILASTGLLDGRNATTNKAVFKVIAAKHPSVNWVRKARWVVDGKYWTSSGISAGLDMGHAFIEDQYTKSTADFFARIQEIEPITDSSNDPFEYVIDMA